MDFDRGILLSPDAPLGNGAPAGGAGNAGNLGSAAGGTGGGAGGAVGQGQPAGRMLDPVEYDQYQAWKAQSQSQGAGRAAPTRDIPESLSREDLDSILSEREAANELTSSLKSAPDRLSAKVDKILGKDDLGIGKYVKNAVLYNLERMREDPKFAYPAGHPLHGKRLPGITDAMIDEAIKDLEPEIKAIRGRKLAAIGDAANQPPTGTPAGQAGDAGAPEKNSRRPGEVSREAAIQHIAKTRAKLGGAPLSATV